jgi:flagellar biosynthetic protein FliR
MTANELLARFSEQQVAAFFLVLARISPLFLLAPLFSSKMIPPRVRSIIAVALAVGLMPVVKHGVIDLDPLAYGGLIVKEVVVGLAFAYALAAMFAGLQVAGSLLDTLIGFSFGSLIDPVTGNQSTVIAQLYSLFGVAILIAIGGDGWIIKGLGRTYEAVPLLDAPAIGSLVEGAQVAFSGIFAAAFMIGAPVIIALTITDAAVGFPAKMIVGLVLLGASLPFVSNYFVGSLQESINEALHFLKAA